MIEEKTYQVIVADPPWNYSLRKSDKTHRNKIPYESMPIEDILALPIPELGDPKGSVLWLWYTNNHVGEAVDCLREWGYTLKTNLTWVKVCNDGIIPRMGTGHWLRNCTEHCFLAVKGNVKSFAGTKCLTNQKTVLRSPREEHSRKPEKFYLMVEELMPGATRLELFSRQERPDWDTWGDQAGLFKDERIIQNMLWDVS